MVQLRGKQIFDGSIEASKLSTAAINFLKYVQDQKDASRLASGANIASLASVSLADFDGTAQGVTLADGDRVLLWQQTTASQNGIYTVTDIGGGNGSLARSTDADEDAEVTQGMATAIVEGTYAKSNFILTTIDPIVVDTTNLTFVEVKPFPGNNGPTQNDKGVAALATVADEDQGGPAISGTPANDIDVSVLVNGLRVALKGNKTGDCYFSGDGGTTARNLNDITAGDTLHWMGSIAGYELAVSDILDYEYTVDA